MPVYSLIIRVRAEGSAGYYFNCVTLLAARRKRNRESRKLCAGAQHAGGKLIYERVIRVHTGFA